MYNLNQNANNNNQGFNLGFNQPALNQASLNYNSMSNNYDANLSKGNVFAGLNNNLGGRLGESGGGLTGTGGIRGFTSGSGGINGVDYSGGIGGGGLTGSINGLNGLGGNGLIGGLNTNSVNLNSVNGFNSDKPYQPLNQLSNNTYGINGITSLNSLNQGNQVNQLNQTQLNQPDQPLNTVIDVKQQQQKQEVYPIPNKKSTKNLKNLKDKDVKEVPNLNNPNPNQNQNASATPNQEKPSPIQERFINLFMNNKHDKAKANSANFLKTLLIILIVIAVLSDIIMLEVLCLYMNVCYGEKYESVGWLSHTVIPVLIIFLLTHFILYLGVEFMNKSAITIVTVIYLLLSLLFIGLGIYSIVIANIRKPEEMNDIWSELSSQSRVYYYDNNINTLIKVFKSKTLTVGGTYVSFFVFCLALAYFSSQYNSASVDGWRPILASSISDERAQRYVEFFERNNPTYQLLRKNEGMAYDELALIATSDIKTKKTDMALKVNEIFEKDEGKLRNGEEKEEEKIEKSRGGKPPRFRKDGGVGGGINEFSGDGLVPEMIAEKIADKDEVKFAKSKDSIENSKLEDHHIKYNQSDKERVVDGIDNIKYRQDNHNQSNLTNNNQNNNQDEAKQTVKSLLNRKKKVIN